MAEKSFSDQLQPAFQTWEESESLKVFPQEVRNIYEYLFQWEERSGYLLGALFGGAGQWSGHIDQRRDGNAGPRRTRPFELCRGRHGEAPDEDVRKWQERINPIWKRLAGGCNINRRVPQLIEESGFKIEDIDTMYLPGSPKFAAFQYWGSATQR